MDRREVMTGIAGGLGGIMIGYYAGAKELLGIQNTRTVVAEEPRVDDSDSSSDSSSGSSNGGSSTPKPEQENTPTPTSTKGTGRFVDEFERSDIPNLVALEGNEHIEANKDYWSITEGIEGRSLTGAGGEGEGEGGLVRYDSDKFSWSGDRRISVQFKTDTSLSKQHAQLYFWDDGSWWQVAASIPLNKFRLRHENQDQIQGLPIIADTPMSGNEPHRFEVTIRGRNITAAFDGQELIEYSHSSEIGEGSVGFGIGRERVTWYDNLQVEPL